MILRLDDVAVFVANWGNKVDNIRHVQSVLNIGFDSMVYLDDSPFERAMVKQAIPSLTVPELPEDPADYLQVLRSLNLFETGSVSETDEVRTHQYQDESRRAIIQKTYDSEDGFLASLGMVATVRPFDAFHVPRIAQLSHRSNQFNLRTVRYAERDVERITSDRGYVSRYFSLKDAVGDYGLIGLVVLKKSEGCLFIENWLMSCRVLKRGMEEFVLNAIMQVALECGLSKVVASTSPRRRISLSETTTRSWVSQPKAAYGLWKRIGIPSERPTSVSPRRSPGRAKARQARSVGWRLTRTAAPPGSRLPAGR